MKLEFESNTTAFPSVENDFQTGIKPENISVEAAEMLNAGIKAAQEGRRSEARNLLLQVTEMDSENENAWLWLASISEYPEELLIFLNSVLKINPENERALDWAQATKTLLSKTFVQRGIDASKDVRKDFAKQCFLQAIVHDNQNEMAWLWLASVADSDEEKTSHLQKVLNINPENVMAQASFKSIRKQMAETHLHKAFASAGAGENEQALEALQEVFKKSPEMADAWILKSFLVRSCDEKLACFEQALELNPGNNLAQANAEFLRAMWPKVENTEIAEEVYQPEEAEMEAPEAAFDSNAQESEMVAEDMSPTEELEFPQAAEDEFSDEAPQAEFEEIEAQVDSVEMEEVEFEAREAESEFVEKYEAQEAEAVAEEMQNQWEFAEEKAESAAEDFSDVEEIPQVYAFQEAEAAEQPAFEEEEIHQTEAAEYYAEAEEAAENQALEEDSTEDVYEIEADELYSDAAEKAEEMFFEEEFEEELVVEEEQPYDVEENVRQAQPAISVCPFCDAENEPQAFVCNACRAVLTLSDLEMLLAGQDGNKDIIGDRVEQLEKSKKRSELEVDELKVIAVGHLNLKNLKKGLLYLNEAARLVPDDIVLSSQVNALKIRHSEIERQESVHSSMPRNRTILVVDDSATVRKLISGKLEKCGHEVICAIDGVDALEKLKEFSPDLILLDINMPRMDGYQVCKMIRGNEEMKETPIVMISGKDGFFDKVRGRMAGTTGYITKPFGPETLMKTVETYILQPV
jgi:CheY-like chemotaxis protein